MNLNKNNFKLSVFLFISFLSISLLTSCKSDINNDKYGLNDAAVIHDLYQGLTDAIVADGFSPPVAARIYAYAFTAAYEVARHYDADKYPSNSGRLNELQLSGIEMADDVNIEIATIAALTKTGGTLVYKGYMLDSVRDVMLSSYQTVHSSEIKKAVDYGNKIAEQLLEWSAGDHYKKTRSMPKFEVSDAPGSWQPTPPLFGDALEPYWHLLRPFYLDSAGQFGVNDPPLFSTNDADDYHASVMEVFKEKNSSIPEDKEIAQFWDCNPIRTYVKGHVMFNRRQLTPAGHWLFISQYASRSRQLNLADATYSYFITATGMHDAFLGCWHEKYRTNFIRPETYINEYVDPKWTTLVETPLFPEYPSGHSTVSASAATVLTHIHGDTIAFTDSSQVDFLMPPRSFKNFREAANEAAVSRVKAGIHYWEACNEGIDLGNKIGNYILAKMPTDE